MYMTITLRVLQDVLIISIRPLRKKKIRTFARNAFDWVFTRGVAKNDLNITLFSYRIGEGTRLSMYFECEFNLVRILPNTPLMIISGRLKPLKRI